ncbi:MAG: glucosamine-6-phosphate deaminase [Anaerolineae bacterium]
MILTVYPSKATMARAAASHAADLLREAIAARGQAVFVAATGASQFEFLDELCTTPDIDWSRTVMFHLDEYIGLPEDHPASFRRYLKERLISRVHPGTVHLIQGDAPDPEAECRRLNELIARFQVDVAFVGIGENGHLAFNDPPADFETRDPYIIVHLDEACRRQQLGEGWFATLEEVPERAISMSIQQIMSSRAIICTVPDERKAQAVRDCFTGEVTPLHPASILRQHPRAYVYLDPPAASLLPKELPALRGG